jgi:DinB superfamily
VNADAERLADELAAANDEVIAFVETCPDERWAAMVTGEDWPVGVVMHHIAVGHLQMLDWLGRARRGDAITKTASEIDADNARHARDFAGVTPGDTAEELRRHGAALRECIGGLSADELATSVSFGPGDGMAVTTEQLASVAARHCRGHLDDARPAAESGIA